MIVSILKWELRKRWTGDIHGVRWCSHQNCTTRRWNRDVNAARNMRRVFLHMLEYNQQLPAAFKQKLARWTRRPPEGRRRCEIILVASAPRGVRRAIELRGYGDAEG